MLSHCMILAAGTGTRLKPLTDHKPKALAEINGTPLLEIIITNLVRQGISSFTVNIHHYPDQILAFLEQKKNFGVPIQISNESDNLLDSGGGILKARQFFPPGEDILIHNVDVISNLKINEFCKFHQSHQALASLAVRDRITHRYYLFNEQLCLQGWMNVKTGEKMFSRHETNLQPLAFSGISILSSEFLQSIIHQGTFPIRDELIRQSDTSRISGYRHDKDIWIDVGKPEQLKEAEALLQKSPFFYD
ncbi:MAG: NDP-sugar synthase [Bacteroidales bacterium]